MEDGAWLGLGNPRAWLEWLLFLMQPICKTVRNFAMVQVNLGTRKNGNVGTVADCVGMGATVVGL